MTSAENQNNSKKVLTLVIPTYNMERYLGTCLDSVTASCVENTLEVIVVNDGSKDRSLAIAQSYQEKRPDIVRIIDKKNGNYGSCVNAGLKQATGKYFRILDADDWFGTEGLVELMKKMETLDTDLIITSVVQKVYKGDQLMETNKRTFNPELKEKILTNDHPWVEKLDAEGQLGMHSMTFKTEILHQCQLQLIEGISYTDTIYYFQPFAKVKDFIFLDIDLYHYRLGREGQTVDRKLFAKHLTDITQVYERIFQIMDATPQTESLKTNQGALLRQPLRFMLSILKHQKSIPETEYGRLTSIIQGINKYHLHYKVLHRWYFFPWKLTENPKVLNSLFRVRGWFSK